MPDFDYLPQNGGSARMPYDPSMAKAQTQALYSEWQSRGTEVVRDASLRNKADEAASYLVTAHSLMDELEAAIHGPQLREMPKEGTSGGPASHPGLRVVLDENSARAAALVSRLQTLIGSL